jgi:nicotinate-nucleotide adenylyltransferase
VRIGVLGGTFDPIHNGHLILASCAYEQLELQEVRFLPAGDPWRKAGVEVSPASRRLEMVRLATAGDPRFSVDESEVRREGPSYTADTLLKLKDELGPKAEIFLLLGEDALEDMRYWHRPEDIFAAAKLAVAPRFETPVPSPPRGNEAPPLQLPPIERIDMPCIGINATDLRARVRRGGSLAYLVPAAIEAYIKKQRLYQAPANPPMRRRS